MQISLVPVRVDEKAALEALMQDYVLEMSGLIGRSPVPTDLLLTGYWSDPDRWPYWIRVSRANAGFALVRRIAGGRFEIAEFFVKRPFRRQGVGLAAARQLVLLRPGEWRVTQHAVNAGAVAFWHHVLDGFVAYDERTTSTDAVRREQTFAV